MARLMSRNRPAIPCQDEEETPKYTFIHHPGGFALNQSTACLLCCLPNKRAGKGMASQNEETIGEKSDSRDLSWFERLYQKFESVCTEVDNSPSSFVKGTAKYVENQANLVGSNVRKLYTQFMQDLLALNNSTPEVSVMSEPERVATCSMETATTVIKPRQEDTDGTCIMESQADSDVVDTSENLESMSGHRSIENEVQNQMEFWDAGEEEIPIAQEEMVKSSTDAVDRLLRQRKSKSTAVLISDDNGEEQGVGDDTEPDWELI